MTPTLRTGPSLYGVMTTNSRESFVIPALRVVKVERNRPTVAAQCVWIVVLSPWVGAPSSRTRDWALPLVRNHRGVEYLTMYLGLRKGRCKVVMGLRAQTHPDSAPVAGRARALPPSARPLAQTGSSPSSPSSLTVPANVEQSPLHA